MAKRTGIYTDELKHANPIPAASRIGNMVMSGIINGIDPATGKAAGTLEEQCRHMFGHVKRIVEAAGGSTDDILKLTVWLKDRSQRDALNVEWVKMFPDKATRPARHTMRGDLEGANLIQCDFTAVIGAYMLRRRDLLISVAAAGPALVLARAAAAAFPEKDIAFLIPDSPGGGFDNYVRALSPVLEKTLPRKVNVIPTNVPGAGGARAASELYRAKPDGAAMAIFNVPGIYVQRERSSGGFDLDKFAWLGRVGQDRYGLAVAATSPIKSVADLQALSKTRAVKFTSTGPAGTAYSATLIATHLLDIKAQLITGYKGSSDYVVGAIRGDGDAVITALPLLRRLAAGNTLRIIATFEERSSVPGAQDATSLGQPELAHITLERLVAGPPGLPAEIKTILAGALAQALKDPEIVAWAQKADTALSPASADDAAAIMRDQANFMQKWKKLLGAG